MSSFQAGAGCVECFLLRFALRFIGLLVIEVVLVERVSFLGLRLGSCVKLNSVAVWLVMFVFHEMYQSC